MKRATHKILHTYINRSGRIESRVRTGLHGATDEQAQHTFDAHVRAAKHAWENGSTWNGVPVRITAVVLIDAAENVLEQWTYVPEAQAAA